MSSASQPGAEGWRVLGLTCGAMFVVSLDATVVVAAFPELRRQFAAVSPATLSWVLNAYTLVYASLLVPMGRWGDAHGRRRAFLTGLATFTLSSFACGLAPNPAALIAARIVQAIGAALLTPAALALVLRAAARENRAALISVWGAVGGLAAAIGPALGSWLMEAISWRAIFWINVPAGALIGWRAARGLVESRASDEGVRPDWLGSLLLAGGIAMITLGVFAVQEAGAFSWKTSSWAAAGVVLLAVFVRWARGRANAALDLTLFRNRNYRLANLATLVFGAAFGLMFFSSFLFLTGVWGYAQSRAGLAATVGPLMVIPAAIVGGRLAGRAGYRLPLATGASLYTAGMAWYFFHVRGTPDYLHAWLPGQLMSGAAIGLVLPSLGGAAAASLPPSALGAGNAVNTAVRQFGSVLGVAAGAMMIGHAGATLEQFRLVYASLAAAGIATGALALPVDAN
jgi:EmrB/QacA subfamily drug resistance transporter